MYLTNHLQSTTSTIPNFSKVSSGMSQEEARRRVGSIESKHATELARLEERNRELRSRLLESTYENTKRLRDVADLSSRQFTLEKVERPLAFYLFFCILMASNTGNTTRVS